jgi:hypothetical protein
VAGIEHGIDELEDGALIGGRELLDALQALQETIARLSYEA